MKREEKVIVVFDSTAHAMEMEAVCQKSKISGRLIPTPSNITAGCGLAWCAERIYKKQLMTFLDEMELEYRGIYNVMLY
ncbi:MAG: DUF3343 domain-containing protein [Clostridiales bacterium]|nr:DUF3343 domain-containing protein [Clostridiales bacterium]